MHNFNIEGPRTRDNLKIFNDIAIILKYLYCSKDHTIETNGYNLIMDADQNILLRPVEENGNKITKSKDNGFYICQNDISYIELMKIAENLRKEGKMEEMAISVLYSETMHW